MDWEYWGRPVAGFGDPDARIWILGLAPAAHGANRTGRVFTGDRSGDFLFASLYRCGIANQPTSVSRDDGLALVDCFISASARCAPPDNKPLPDELANCSIYLDSEWRNLKHKRVVLALGAIAWAAGLALVQRNAVPAYKVKPTFAHGAEAHITDDMVMVGSYHVSQQNTFTGRLTTQMFDKVVRRCQAIANEFSSS